MVENCTSTRPAARLRTRHRAKPPGPRVLLLSRGEENKHTPSADRPTHRLPPHAGIFSSDMQVKLRWCEGVMRERYGRRCRSPSVFGVRLSRATERKRPPLPPKPPPTTAELIKTNAFRTKCRYITTAGKQSRRRKTVNKTRQLARGTISTRRDVPFPSPFCRSAVKLRISRRQSHRHALVAPRQLSRFQTRHPHPSAKKKKDSLISHYGETLKEEEEEPIMARTHTHARTKAHTRTRTKATGGRNKEKQLSVQLNTQMSIFPIPAVHLSISSNMKRSMSTLVRTNLEQRLAFFGTT